MQSSSSPRGLEGISWVRQTALFLVYLLLSMNFHSNVCGFLSQSQQDSNVLTLSIANPIWRDGILAASLPCCTLHFQVKYTSSGANTVHWAMGWKTPAPTIAWNVSNTWDIMLVPLRCIYHQGKKALPHIQRSWKGCPSMRHHSRGILGKKTQLFSLWQPWSTQQPPQQPTSDLYKKLAQRFVYEELKVKSDFKIAQPPVTAQRVTFFSHLSLLPFGTSSFAQKPSQNGLQTGQKPPPRWEGRNPRLKNWRKGGGSCKDAQQLMECLLLAQKQRCSRGHACLQQLDVY